MPRAWRCLARPGGRNRLAHLCATSRHAAHLPFSGRSTLCHLTLPGILSTLSEGCSPGAAEDFRWRAAWLREGKKNINGCKLGLAWLGLAWPGDNKCYLIRNCLPFHMLFTQPSNIGCLSLSETVYVLIQVFTTYKSTNDSLF